MGRAGDGCRGKAMGRPCVEIGRAGAEAGCVGWRHRKRHLCLPPRAVSAGFGHGRKTGFAISLGNRCLCACICVYCCVGVLVSWCVLIRACFRSRSRILESVPQLGRARPDAWRVCAREVLVECGLAARGGPAGGRACGRPEVRWGRLEFRLNMGAQSSASGRGKASPGP